MIKKILKRSLALALLGLWLLLNLKLYHAPRYVVQDGGRYSQGVYDQLQWLKQARQEGASLEMQGLFPEGYLFFEALYGLAWANVIEGLDTDDPVYLEGQAEIALAHASATSDFSKKVFSPNMPLPYGAFYQNWNAYLLGRWLEATPPVARDSSRVQDFKARCGRIADALAESPTPYLWSYHQASWPADMVVGVAALALHDRLFAPQYAPIIQAWLRQVKARLDDDGLVPHAAHHQSGAPLQEARGSSQSLMLCFWPQIDSAFAQDQYARYKRLFVRRRFGLPAVYEFRAGSMGLGDVDSGPLLFGVGPSATIVGVGANYRNGGTELAAQLRNNIEAFGMAATFGDGKRYVFGQLPIADVFIAWTGSMAKGPTPLPLGWAWRFHLGSTLLVVCILLWPIALRGWRARQRANRG